jgi:hypothetical protein
MQGDWLVGDSKEVDRAHRVDLSFFAMSTFTRLWLLVLPAAAVLLREAAGKAARRREQTGEETSPSRYESDRRLPCRGQRKARPRRHTYRMALLSEPSFEI